MSKNITVVSRKKSGGLEHGDECPKRIRRCLSKEIAGFLVRYVDPKDLKNPQN